MNGVWWWVLLQPYYDYELDLPPAQRIPTRPKAIKPPAPAQQPVTADDGRWVGERKRGTWPSLPLPEAAAGGGGGERLCVWYTGGGSLVLMS